MIQQQEKKLSMSKLNLNDLLTSLAGAKSQQQGTKQALLIPKFVENVVQGKNKKIYVLTKKQQEMMRRQSNYEMAKEEMDKWVGIIKVNREKESLNFQKKQIANLNVNFFPAQPINEFHKKLQSKLESMNVQSQKSVLKHQQSILEKVDPQEAKRRLLQARKHRTAIFYEQQKRRRIAKIKSKLYRKIKKRQRQRQQIQNIQKMGPGQKNEYIEKLTKQRIKERITLRHNTKNKHIQNLLRFNRSEKNIIQESINEANSLRHKKMERLNEDLMEDISEQYDDENFQDQAMKDLEAEIQAIERQQAGQGEMVQENQIDAKLNDLKFLKNANAKRTEKQKEDAYKIFNKLVKGKQLKEKDVNSDADSEQNGGDISDDQSKQAQQGHRKIYGSKIKQNEQENPHKNTKTNVQIELRKYLLSGGQNEEEKQQKSKMLIEDINFQGLKNKYQSDRVPIDLTTLIEQNKEIYGSYANEAVLENIRQFEQEKYAEIQEQVTKKQANQTKKPKGWGSWVGPGITQKKIDPQEQLRKKLKMIEEIKKKRKDNSLANVTITQVRNKNLSDYMVRDLPHNYANADQFDYMQSEPVGHEWNSFSQFTDNIKPKIIAKAGQVITPAQLPKSAQNKKKQ